MQSVRLSLLVCTCLLVLTLFAYGRVWDNDFVNLDDEPFITRNEHVVNGLTLSDLHWAWTTTFGASWIPLTWMSLQLDSTLSAWLRGPTAQAGPLAWVCHGQNLFWHSASVILLFLVLQRLTGSVWPSAVVAALAAVHPLHVESVAWATERKDVLSTFFWVLTLLAYARYVERPSWSRYVLIVVAFVLGLLAKPMLLTLPFTLLLMDFWPLGRWSADWRRLGWLLGEKVPLFAITAGITVLTLVTQKPVDQLYEQPLPFPDRLANAVASYGWYVEKTFWPTDLAVFYCHPLGDWQWPPVLMGSAILLVGTAFAVVSIRQWPWVLVGWLWFLGTLVPVIGLLQVGWQSRADRYAYVPHIGLFIAVVWSVAALRERLRLPAWPVAALTAGCLVLLAILTRTQVETWHDTETVWTHAVEVTKDNHRAICEMGRAIFKRAEKDGDAVLLAEARSPLEEAVRLQPNEPHYRIAFGLVLLRQEDYAGAAEQLQQALRLNPSQDRAWHTLGTTQRRLGQYEKAVASFAEELKASPNDPDTHAELGLTLWQLHRKGEAEQELRRALQLQPDHPDALNGLGVVLIEQGKNEEALDHFSRAIKSNLLLVEAYHNGGLVLRRLGKGEEARICHELAVKYEQARLKTRPTASTATLAGYLDALAAAWAEEGEFEKAIQTAKQAYANAATPGQARATAARIAMYEKRQAGELPGR